MLMAAHVYDIKTKKKIEPNHFDLEVLDQLAKRKTHRTPDFMELKLQKHHPLFVYGNLKGGGPYHEILKGASFLGDAITSTIAYQMKYWDGPISQPVLTRCNPNQLAAARVVGEVYAVSTRQILEIDELLENTEVFKRDRTFVTLKDQTYSTRDGLKHPTLKCWAYMGSEYWDTCDLTPCGRFSSQSSTFYEWDAIMNQDFSKGYSN